MKMAVVQSQVNEYDVRLLLHEILQEDRQYEILDHNEVQSMNEVLEQLEHQILYVRRKLMLKQKLQSARCAINRISDSQPLIQDVEAEREVHALEKELMSAELTQLSLQCKILSHKSGVLIQNVELDDKSRFDVGVRGGGGEGGGGVLEDLEDDVHGFSQVMGINLPAINGGEAGDGGLRVRRLLNHLLNACEEQMSSAGEAPQLASLFQSVQGLAQKSSGRLGGRWHGRARGITSTEELHEFIADACRATADLEEALAAANSEMAPLTSKVEALQNSVKNSQDDNADLSRRLKSAERRANDIGDAQTATLRDMQMEHDKAIEAQRRDLTLAHQQQPGDERMLAQLRAAISNVTTEKTRAEAKSKSLQDHLERYKSDHVELLDVVREKDSAIGSERDQRVKVEAALAEAQSAHEQSQKELVDTRNRTAMEIEVALDEQMRANTLLETQLTQTKERHDAVRTQAKSLEAEIEGHTARAKTADDEVRGLETELVRLKTEVAILESEKQEARGTRSQRETANGKSSATETALRQELRQEQARRASLDKRLRELQNQQMTRSAAYEVNMSDNVPIDVQNKLLQEELNGMLADYERMTSSLLKAEKEREAAESMMDKLREKCEQLQTQLDLVRIQSLGRTPGSEDDSMDGVSTSTMRVEFRKMVTDMRADHFKKLKVESQLFASCKANCLR